MKISGHETPEVFQRYNLKDRRDLVEAMEKLAEFHRVEDLKLERAPARPYLTALPYRKPSYR